jgi:hypothetical protein
MDLSLLSLFQALKLEKEAPQKFVLYGKSIFEKGL